MSVVLNSLLDMLTSLVANYLPVFNFADEYIQSIRVAVVTVRDFMVNANFIVPLPDIAAIIIFDFAIRSYKFLLFAGNWIIRRIVDAVP